MAVIFGECEVSGASIHAPAGNPAEQEAVYAIASLVAAPLPLEELLAEALPPILKATGFSGGAVRLLDAPTGQLALVAHYGLRPEVAAHLPQAILTGEAPGGLSAQHRAPVLVSDFQQSGYSGSVWGRGGYQTFLSQPLQYRGMLLGTLNLAAERPLDLTEADLRRVGVMVAPLALAVANTELYGGAQRKIQYLAALHQCSQDIGPAPNLERVISLTADRVAHLLGLSRTVVLLRDEGLQEMVGGASHGFPEGAVHDLRVACPFSPEELAEQGGRVSLDPVGEGWLPESFVRAQGIGEVLLVPLRAHEQTVGILMGDRSGEPLPLSANELELAMIFANQAAVWIAGARLLVREQAARATAEAARTELEALLELAPDAILTISRDGAIALVNSQAETMFGYRREELIGQPVEVLMPGRFREGHVRHREHYHVDPRTRPMGSGLALFAQRRGGEEFPVEISLGPTRSERGASVIAVIRDISARRQAEEERSRLLASEQQKGEQLKLAIREAHHRIKNNLQAISDLLYLELSTSDQGRAPTILRESVERIQSIALVHDLLSQDEDVQTVDARQMVERLVPMVLRSSGHAAGRVRTAVLVPRFPLSSKKATTLALIVNELVSNAAKHALSQRQGAELEVRLEEANDGLRLRVQDNGPGLPEGFDLSRDANVGLQVIRTLAERDLQGKFSLSSGAGLRAEVWFPW